MTLDEMQEAIMDGDPFVVFGEAMRFSSAETGWTDPHAWYRHHISQGRIAVEVESESEHNALLSKAIAELATLKEENARLKAAAIGRGMVSEMANMAETAVLVCGLHDQLAAYKAEAMAAREYIAMLELNARFVYETAPVRLAYMAARVKDV